MRLSALCLLAGIVAACSSGKNQGPAGGGDTQLGAGSGGEGADGGAGAGAGTAGSGGQCQVAACSGPLACCTAAGVCGRSAPSQVFRSTCVDATPRGGELASSCPDSREYCQRTRCKTFRGCTLSPGDAGAPAGCGYWVEGWEIVGGEEVIELTAQLDCVPTEEFASP